MDIEFMTESSNSSCIRGSTPGPCSLLLRIEAAIREFSSDDGFCVVMLRSNKRRKQGDERSPTFVMKPTFNRADALDRISRLAANMRGRQGQHPGWVSYLLDFVDLCSCQPKASGVELHLCRGLFSETILESVASQGDSYGTCNPHGLKALMVDRGPMVSQSSIVLHRQAAVSTFVRNLIKARGFEIFFSTTQTPEPGTVDESSPYSCGNYKPVPSGAGARVSFREPPGINEVVVGVATHGADQNISVSDILSSLKARADSAANHSHESLECRGVRDFFVEASLAFWELGTAASKPLSFELDERNRPSFQSDGGFIMYQYARAASLCDVAWDRTDSIDLDVSLLDDENEWALIVDFIAEFPRCIERTVPSSPSDWKDCRIRSNLIIDLMVRGCRRFSSWFSHSRIIDNDNPKTTKARMALVSAFLQVLDNGIRLLGLNNPPPRRI